MKTRQLTPSKTLGLCTLMLAGIWSPATNRANAAEADPVLAWNEILQSTVALANPHFQSRAGATTQLAVFEAVNAIVGDYEPYLGTISAPAGASPEAATVAAAYRDHVYFIDDDGYLEMDDVMFGDLARRLNPEVAWWQD